MRCSRTRTEVFDEMRSSQVGLRLMALANNLKNNSLWAGPDGLNQPRQSKDSQTRVSLTECGIAEVAGRKLDDKQQEALNKGLRRNR